MSLSVDRPFPQWPPTVLWRRAALVWAVLWGLSLVTPVLPLSGGAHVFGWKVLIGGWSISLVLLTLWMANPFAVILAGWVYARRRPFKGLGILVGVLALLAIPATWPLTGVSVGFWLWIASFLPLGAADIVTFRDPRVVPEAGGV
ncbi:hypothetical protein BH09PSE2_BH09PSE2_25390 [soil metagenome]